MSCANLLNTCYLLILILQLGLIKLIEYCVGFLKLELSRPYNCKNLLNPSCGISSFKLFATEDRYEMLQIQAYH